MLVFSWLSVIISSDISCAATLTVDTRLQPIFHTPGVYAAGYCGDPNGLMFREDTQLYHLFWQCTSPPETGMEWCHAVSKDYVRWKRLPVALPPGSFSGGATQLASGGVRMLYKDVNKRKFYTASPANLSDPQLIKWKEDVLPTAIVGVTDPSRGWLNPTDGNMYVLVGSVGEKNTALGAYALWRATDDSFSNFSKTDTNFFEFKWDFKNSQVPRDPNFYSTRADDGRSLWVLQGAMKMCAGGGNDFYTLGEYDTNKQSFIAIDPMRTMSTDPYDFGHGIFASQTFAGKGGSDGPRIMSSWVLEGDCDPNHWPMKCPATTARGWLGVHSLPRVVTGEMGPPLPGSTKQRYALKFAPLPALQTLRTGMTSTAQNVSGSTVRTLNGFKSQSFQIDLTFPLPDVSSNWDVGTQLLWSDDSKEFTRIGIRSAVWLEGSELVYMNKDVQANSTCTAPYSVKDAKACQSSCLHSDVCIGWSAVPNDMINEAGVSDLAYECRLFCNNVPLQSASKFTCGWSTPHDPSRSVSGMKGLWASVYIQRNMSSLAESFGKNTFAGLVRVFPSEASVKLSVFADKSIVEAFAMDGRTVVTARVYPTLATATNVGAFANEASNVAVQAWDMGPAFDLSRSDHPEVFI